MGLLFKTEREKKTCKYCGCIIDADDGDVCQVCLDEFNENDYEEDEE